MKFKKIIALSGTALLAGVSLCNAAALADLPSLFVMNGEFDANIIVGSQSWNDAVVGNPAGIASDIAGAIDVAAAFAQEAKEESKVILEREITPGAFENISVEEKIDSLYNNSVFNWLVNNSNNYEVIEVDGAEFNSEGYLDMDNSIYYKVIANGSVAEGEDWTLFGKDYEILSVSSNEVIFGTTEKLTGIERGETVKIGNAEMTFNNVDSTGEKVYVTIKDEETVVVDDESFDIGKDFSNLSDRGWYIKLEGLRGMNPTTLDIKYATQSVKINDSVTSLEESFPNVNWSNTDDPKITTAGNNLTSIEIEAPDDLELLEGESMEIMNYFNISFEGWEPNNYTSIIFTNEFGNDEELSFTNEEKIDVNLNPVLIEDSNGVWTDANDDFEDANLSEEFILADPDKDYKLQFGFNQSGAPHWRLWNDTDIEKNFSMIGTGNTAYGLFNLTNGWWNVSATNETLNVTMVNYSSMVEFGGMLNISKTGRDSRNMTLRFDDPDETITLTYEDGILEEDTDYFTTWGTKVNYDGEIIFPENRRILDAWIGRQSIEQDEFGIDDEVGEYKVIDSGFKINRINSEIGKIDIEVDEIEKPSILVGGYMVNKLVNDMNLSESRELSEDRAYIKLTEIDEQTVMIVAGYEAKDTRLACNAIAEGVIETSSDIAWIDTSTDNYTLIDV